jgi:hypothetical protein
MSDDQSQESKALELARRTPNAAGEMVDLIRKYQHYPCLSGQNFDAASALRILDMLEPATALATATTLVRDEEVGCRLKGYAANIVAVRLARDGLELLLDAINRTPDQ